MKINWKLRFQNKTTLLAIIAALLAFVYQTLGLFGITPPISQDAIYNVIGLLINLLCLLGIVVDSTTEGISDSDRAMMYDKPHSDEDYK